MHSGDLSREQLSRLYHRIKPAADYLAALHERMNQTGFTEADRLYKEVAAARLTTQLLADDIHRLWTGPGYRSDF